MKLQVTTVGTWYNVYAYKVYATVLTLGAVVAATDWQAAGRELRVMLIVGEGVVWCLGFPLLRWWWPAGFVVLYAVPAVFAFVWLGITVPTHVLVLSLMLAAALIVLSEIDRRAFRLPDMITIPLGLSGILAATITSGGSVGHGVSAGL